MFSYISWLIVLALAIISIQPADAKHAPKGAADDNSAQVDHQRLVDIPIFFITDRNREPCHDKEQKAAFGRLRQYVGHCGHDPHVGVAYVAIDNHKHKVLDDKLKKLGWEPGKRHIEGAYSVSLIEGCTYDEAKTRFYDDLYNRSLLNADRNIFVFAPGYMSTFESGLKEAARFAYYAERPVLLYSWPSKGKFRDYSADESSVEWSQHHYNEMISELSKLAEKQQPASVRLVAHSMGSRLLLRAIPLIREKNNFAEVAFVCPDVDDGVVKHYIHHCLDSGNKAMVRLYMSHKDEMLKLSQFVHGGYARLGEEDSIVSPSPYKKKQCDDGITESLKRFQTIDFTSMDTGTLGHKIPVHLVTAMSLEDKPPSDIEIVLKKKHEDDCSSVMLDIARMPNQDESTVGYFKVRALEHKTPVLGAVRGKLPVLHTFFGKDWTMK